MTVMNASGKMINPFELKDEDFDVDIVAQTLSRICRFWGQTTEFYSVAQHCICMQELFDDIELKKWAMAHEFFEGLTGLDIPSPIKHDKSMRAYVEAENRCLLKAADLFFLTKPIPKEIKIADKRLMVTEAMRFMSSENYDWTQIAKPYHIGVISKPLGIDEAKEEFKRVWHHIFK